jgi:hypothetical protein
MLLLNFVLLLISLLLMVYCLVSTNWVAWGESNSEQEKLMGLTRCDDCPPGQSYWSWVCIESFYCRKKEASGFCQAATAGTTAGTLYTIFELISLVFGVLLAEKIVIYVTGFDYGNALVAYECAGLMVA